MHTPFLLFVTLNINTFAYELNILTYNHWMLELILLVIKVLLDSGFNSPFTRDKSLSSKYRNRIF